MDCVYPGCENTTRTRGLCHGHYQTMRDRVRKGQVTEADLEARGLLMPKGTGGTAAPDTLDAFRTGSTVRGHADDADGPICPTCEQDERDCTADGTRPACAAA